LRSEGEGSEISKKDQELGARGAGGGGGGGVRREDAAGDAYSSLRRFLENESFGAVDANYELRERARERETSQRLRAREHVVKARENSPARRQANIKRGAKGRGFGKARESSKEVLEKGGRGDGSGSSLSDSQGEREGERGRKKGGERGGGRERRRGYGDGGGRGGSVREEGGGRMEDDSLDDSTAYSSR